MISPVKIWRRQKEVRKILGKEGKIVTFTKIFIAGSDFKKYAPYFVVLVKLDDGERSMAQLVDYTDVKVKIGARVKAILRKVREVSSEDVIAYGVKFKLINS